MKRNKTILFVMILIFITVFFSLNFFMDKLRTGLGTGNHDEDFLSKDNDSSNKNRIGGPLQSEDLPNLNFNQKVTATISVTGDVMLHMPQVRSGFDPESNSYNFVSVFEEIRPYISSSDIAIANLETVVAGNELGFSGFPRFNSPEEILKALSDAGFDVLSTANNHSIDQGKKGIINTINNIQKYDMENVGTYKEPMNRVLVKEVNDITIGILAYTYGCNGLESLLTGEELNYMVNIINEERIEKDIKLAEAMGVDMTLVLIHWGNEYQLEPSQEQMLLGSNMLKWGADIVLGSHPHVIQRSEIIQQDDENKFIIYSMGNFVSNQRRETMSNSRGKYTEDGIIITLQIEKDRLRGKTTIANIDYIPTWVHRYTGYGKLEYKIIPTINYMQGSNNGVEELEQAVFSKIKESHEQTMERMDK